MTIDSIIQALILAPEAARVWAAPEPMPLDELQPLLAPFPGAMTADDDAEPARAA